MLILLYIACLVVLSILILQDWRSRTISSPLLLLLALMGVVASLQTQSVSLWGMDVLAFLGFFGLQLGFVFLYFRLTRGRTFKLSSMLGLGDILFIVSLSFFYSFSWMWVIVLGGTLFTILAWIAIQTGRKEKKKSIPFVSTLGVFVLFLELGLGFFSWPNRHESWWLLDTIVQ